MAAREDPLDLELKANWTFVNGVWGKGPDGTLSVPEEDALRDGEAMQGHHYAIDRHLAFRDLDLSFDFRLRPHSDIGIILRAQSPAEFHLLHLPNCGQAFRAKHFWACFSRMEEGYLRLLKLEMIRRVPSTSGIWLSARVSVRGDTIRMGIGNHGVFEARDPEMPDFGHLGLYSFGPADIKGLVVSARGESTDPSIKAQPPPRNWFHPLPAEEKAWQRPGDLVRTPGGDLLLPFSIAKDTLDRGARSYLSRSADGTDWSKPMSLKLHVSSLHVFPDGEMRMISQKDGKFLVRETKDDGESWTPGDNLDVPGPPEGLKELYLGPQGFLNLEDGSVLMLAYGRHGSTQEVEQVYTWSAFHCQAFASRSEDDGWTWSEWKNIDGEMDPTGKPVNGCMDLTEVCAAQVTKGSIIALARPIYSPWMWETWSHDGGKTWEPCVRGAFPGYATPNICRTRSGYLLVAHRLPGCTINTSRDDGVTWDQGTMIDSAIWVMGSMLEVEDDLVLYAYYDSFMGLMRAQFIKVTRDRLVPERRW